MNILDLIKEDHRRVRELVRRLRGSGDAPEASRRLFGGLRNTLERHMDAEEACFYAAIDPEDEELIDEAMAEHEGIFELLGAIDEATPGSEDWRDYLEDLEEMVNSHVEVEETEVFGVARRALTPERLDELGSEFRVRTGRIIERSDTERFRDMDPYVRE